jgi:uncharacterized membrane protein
MDIGPVEYMVVAFPGNRFRGEIAPALAELVESGTIHIVDFAFVHRDGDGAVTALELEQEDSAMIEAFRSVTADRGGLINDADLDEIANALDPDSSALVVVWEDLWAARFAGAVREAGGVVVDIQRIPHDVVRAAVDYAAAEPAGV